MVAFIVNPLPPGSNVKLIDSEALNKSCTSCTSSPPILLRTLLKTLTRQNSVDACRWACSSHTHSYTRSQADSSRFRAAYSHSLPPRIQSHVTTYIHRTPAWGASARSLLHMYIPRYISLNFLGNHAGYCASLMSPHDRIITGCYDSIMTIYILECFEFFGRVLLSSTGWVVSRQRSAAQAP